MFGKSSLLEKVLRDTSEVEETPGNFTRLSTLGSSNLGDEILKIIVRGDSSVGIVVKFPGCTPATQ